MKALGVCAARTGWAEVGERVATSKVRTKDRPATMRVTRLAPSTSKRRAHQV